MTSKLLIGGMEVDGSAEPATILYPWDAKTEVGQCHQLGDAEFAQVLEEAQSGYERFRSSLPVTRMTILSTLANRLRKERESLARLMTLESGKPIKLSRQEVDRAVSVCQGYADLMNRYEESWLYVQDRKARICRVPYGPVLAITPFNFPLNLVMHKLAPAIAAGTSITIKPAPQTPLTALFLGAMAVEAGYLQISVVPCDNVAAEQLVQSPVFQKISFTGSSRVGWRLRELRPKVPMTLELGSNSACIVDDLSVGLPAIAKRCAESAFQFAGQSCISLQRILVQADILEPFRTAYVKASQKLRVGDPMSMQTDVGPLIALSEVQRVRSLLQDAVKQGANLVMGGTTFNAFTYNPTVLDRVHPEMAVVSGEVFAPLAVIEPYEDFDDALALVNRSPYGIHAGVYTADPSKLDWAFEALNVTGLLHNDTPTTRLDYLPYGGLGESGIGRQGVLGGLEEMTYTKALIKRQTS